MMLRGSLLFYLKNRNVSGNGHSLSFAATRCHSLYLSLSFVVPLVVIRCTTRCHSLSLVVIRCHSLSLDVLLVFLFINDRKSGYVFKLLLILFRNILKFNRTTSQNFSLFINVFHSNVSRSNFCPY